MLARIRADFPILNCQIDGKPLVYLDNAATTQKPQKVIQALVSYYSEINSNVHRSVHHLGHEATQQFEAARQKMARFVNAAHPHEIIFTRGTTEAVNLVAYTFGEAFVNEGDEVLVSHMEHHSNFVPWQQLCLRKKARFRVIPVSGEGELDLDAFAKMLSEKTRLVAVTHISNTLGTINPIRQIVELSHRQGVPVLVDGAQGLSHAPVDVQALDCDFYTFSGHKMYAPMGIGGLYGKEAWLEKMPPFHFGGEMIKTVSIEKTTFNELPYKFEAGTPSVADALGLGAAVDYLQETGWDFIQKQESDLLAYATQRLSEIDGLVIYGNAKQKASIVSFLLEGIHFYDMATIIDHYGIAVRSGNHCTMPLMERLGITGTCRASFAFYNTRGEIDRLVEALKKVKEMF